MDSPNTPLSLASSRPSPLSSPVVIPKTRKDVQDRFQPWKLHRAVEMSDISTLAKLVEAGASVNQRKPCGKTPLAVAAAKGLKDVVTFLLNNGADPELECATGEVPLHFASEAGDIGVISALLAVSCNVNRVSKYGMTPLLSLCAFGLASSSLHSSKKVVEKALSFSQPLSSSVVLSEPDSELCARAQLLAQASARVNAVTTERASALHFAAQRGFDKLCELLLKSGAKVNAMTNQKETPLYWVARAVSLEKEAVEKTMQVLHEEGANLMVVNAVGQTPLFVAASCGHFAAVRTLVKLGALVGAGCQSTKETPLHAACAGGYVDVCEYLLRYKARVNAPSESGQTPVHYSVRLGDSLATLQLLVRCKADVNRKDKNERTPLHEACERGQLQFVAELLSGGADPRLKDVDGNTSLHLAVQACHSDVVQALLSLDEDPVHVQNSVGLSPLSVAASTGNIEIITQLLKAGALPEIEVLEEDEVSASVMEFIDSWCADQALLEAVADPETVLNTMAFADPREVLDGVTVSVLGGDTAGNSPSHMASPQLSRNSVRRPSVVRFGGGLSTCSPRNSQLRSRSRSRSRSPAQAYDILHTDANPFFRPPDVHLPTSLPSPGYVPAGKHLLPSPSLRPPRQSLSPVALDPDAVNWQELFSKIKDLPEDTHERIMEKYEQMASLSNRFAQQASHLAQVIITELNMKDKLVQPIEDGIGLDGRPKPVGQAGGIKFRMRNIFFKLAIDHKSIYGNNHEFAAKAAGHELKGALNIEYASIPGLVCPLQCIIDYHGFRLLAVAEIAFPECSKPEYGSDDASKTVYDGNEDVKSKMMQLGSSLNLAPHLAGAIPHTARVLHTACDMEVRRGCDGKLYVIDTHRVFPPEAPGVSTHLFHDGKSIFYRMLRPDFARAWKAPLNPDSFSLFESHDPDASVFQSRLTEATQYLIQTVVPSVAGSLVKKHPIGSLPVDAGVVSKEMHRFGANIRHLGLLRRHAEGSPAVVDAILTELFGRTLKHMLKGHLRDLLLPRSIHERTNAVPLAASDVAAQFLNYITDGASVMAAGRGVTLYRSVVDFWSSVQSTSASYFGTGAIRDEDVELLRGDARRLHDVVKHVCNGTGVMLQDTVASALREDTLKFVFLPMDIAQISSQVQTASREEFAAGTLYMLQALTLSKARVLEATSLAAPQADMSSAFQPILRLFRSAEVRLARALDGAPNNHVILSRLAHCLRHKALVMAASGSKKPDSSSVREAGRIMTQANELFAVLRAKGGENLFHGVRGSNQVRRVIEAVFGDEQRFDITQYGSQMIRLARQLSEDVLGEGVSAPAPHGTHLGPMPDPVAKSVGIVSSARVVPGKYHSPQIRDLGSARAIPALAKFHSPQVQDLSSSMPGQYLGPGHALGMGAGGRYANRKPQRHGTAAETSMSAPQPPPIPGRPPKHRTEAASARQ